MLMYEHHILKICSSKNTRRGLSSAVTGAILLSAVTVLGVGLVGWSNTNLSAHQKTLDSTISTNYNKFSEKLFIENIWFGTGRSMNITMNNIGTIGINVTKIQITNTTSNQIYSFTHTNGGIKPGATLSLQESFGWKTQVPYEIIVFTARDSQFKTNVNGP